MGPVLLASAMFCFSFWTRLPSPSDRVSRELPVHVEGGQKPGHHVSDTFQEYNTSSPSSPRPHQLTFFSGKKNLLWKEGIFRFDC